MLAALVAAPAGYLIAKDQVGTAQSSSAEGERLISTDGLSAVELRALGFSGDEVARILSWREERAVMERLEREDAPSLTVIPERMPASTVEWCREQSGSVEGDVTELSERCKVIELAAEGKLAGGTYTGDELAEAKREAEGAE
jgi:hypothetical protein